MRRAAVVTAAVVGATGCLSLVLNGVAGAPGRDSRPFGPAAAQAAGLTPFDDCQELLDWYVERALPHVGPFGLDGWPMPYAGGPETLRDMSGAQAAADSLSAAADQAQTSSGSGTNVQEVGVDEPDVAKTDGEVVVRVDGAQLVVTDVRTDTARELARLDLPQGMHSPEVLLAGDRVLVLQSGAAHWGPVPVEPMPVGPMPMPMPMGPSRDLAHPYPPAADRSRLLAVSIADPGMPRVVSDQTFGGTTITARQHDEAGGTTVRLVLRTDRPTIDWVQPDRSRTMTQAKEENKERVRASTIEDWLPTVGTGDDRRPLVECSDVSRPAGAEGLGTVTVVSLRVDDLTSWRSTAVTADGQTVYSSADRIYLATPSDKGGTGVHAFALGDGDVRYVASGEVDGTLRDRWSMDEHDGVLRLALAHGDPWRPVENGVTTLHEEGGQLVRVGSVRGLGPDEEIKAVRWFDDLAVVVTFRQTDPFYTVDLSDPARPRTLGELKIPGFSRYLHPIGDDRLVGIGQDADLDGATRGAQAAVFDISDLTDPRRVSTLSLGAHSYAQAEDDPRAFTWLPRSSVALTSVTDPMTGGARLAALRVSPDGDLDEVESWSLPRWGSTPTRTLPLDGARVALVSGDVRVVSVG